MENKKISEWIINTFNKDEVEKIPEWLSERKRTLKNVVDIDNYINECKKESVKFKIAGEHRKQDWEKGWAGDGVYYSNDEYNNTPYYFKKNNYVRLNGKVYEDIDGFAELDFLRVLQSIIFNKAINSTKAKSIIEYGCGTGSNIEFLKKILPNYKYFGSDWAESGCKKLLENKILEKNNIFCVDYFKKESFAAPAEKYIAFTNASLEQVGNRYQDFINYLNDDKNCEIVIHIEPIRDLLNIESPLNRQSYEYEERRGYLDGFYDFIKNLNCKLLLAKDYGIGSKYLSGYQVLIWRRND